MSTIALVVDDTDEQAELRSEKYQNQTVVELYLPP
jgi:hypothetical protein